ncbi:MAG: carbohydrate ABC transporter permease [Dermatophilaceae bacterium]
MRVRRSVPLTVLLWLCVLYFMVPLWWLVVSSTKDNADLFTSFGLWFASDNNLVDNLRTVFTTQDGTYLRWTANTVGYAVGAAVAAMVLSTTAGYAFAVYRFPLSRVLFGAAVGAIMVPGTALAIPTYLVFSELGMTNTAWAVILPSAVTPFGVYLMRVYVADAVPVSCIEAARVDGAGELRIFGQVAVPLLGPGMVTVFLFALVGTWNNYVLPLLVLNDPDLYPLPVGLALQQGQSVAGGGSQVLFSTVITGSLVSVLPLVAAFLFLQRYWRAGLTTGAAKE